MAGKLEKIEAEIRKARAKRAEWDNRIRELEQKYREAENTMIHDMVRAANLTPEQLANLIQMAATQAPNGSFEQFIKDDREEKKYGD